MQSTNIINTPMTEEEAYKILNISDIIKDDKEKIDLIMKQYVKLFNKNSTKTGGSFYI